MVLTIRQSASLHLISFAHSPGLSVVRAPHTQRRRKNNLGGQNFRGRSDRKIFEKKNSPDLKNPDFPFGGGSRIETPPLKGESGKVAKNHYDSPTHVVVCSCEECLWCCREFVYFQVQNSKFVLTSLHKFDISGANGCENCSEVLTTRHVSEAEIIWLFE